MSILEQISKLSGEIEAALAQIKNKVEADTFKSKYLSRKGEVASMFKVMGQVSAEERPAVGKALQELKSNSWKKLDELLDSLETKKTAKSQVDLTLPGKCRPQGGMHILTRLEKEITSIFTRMGFSIERGPEVERTDYNFDMLNTPEWHPARDETDTFYITDDWLLRTETSPTQIRGMLKKVPPIRFIAPGRVYRNDKPDPTHTPMFNQVEGLYVDERVTMSDLKGTLLEFYRALLGKNTNVRFRPHYFPFTEPSAEVDVTCFLCGGKGCRTCKNSGWMEMGGSGMVHPKVFESVSKLRGDDAYHPDKVTGYAFGLGIERLAMLSAGVPDIRMFYENDLRFLAQLH